jgi:hypothetical protein
VVIPRQAKIKMSPGQLPPPAQTFTQPYSTYPQPQAYSQYSTQPFPSVNYASQPQGAVYPSFQVPYGRKDPTSWIDALSPQELSGVDPETASRVMNRFISAELKHEGFDAAEPAALGRLEAEVVHCELLNRWSRLALFLHPSTPAQSFRTYTVRYMIMPISPTEPLHWPAICSI